MRLKGILSIKNDGETVVAAELADEISNFLNKDNHMRRRHATVVNIMQGRDPSTHLQVTPQMWIQIQEIQFGLAAGTDCVFETHRPFPDVGRVSDIGSYPEWTEMRSARGHAHAYPSPEYKWREVDDDELRVSYGMDQHRVLRLTEMNLRADAMRRNYRGEVDPSLHDFGIPKHMIYEANRIEYRTRDGRVKVLKCRYSKDSGWIDRSREFRDEVRGHIHDRLATIPNYFTQAIQDIMQASGIPDELPTSPSEVSGAAEALKNIIKNAGSVGKWYEADTEVPGLGQGFTQEKANVIYAPPSVNDDSAVGEEILVVDSRQPGKTTRHQEMIKIQKERIDTSDLIQGHRLPDIDLDETTIEKVRATIAEAIGIKCQPAVPAHVTRAIECNQGKHEPVGSGCPGGKTWCKHCDLDLT